jgi:hypothetical protein
VKWIWLFITAIPDLIKLLAALQKAADAAETDRKVKTDLQSLHKAINANDASAVSHIFNS